MEWLVLAGVVASFVLAVAGAVDCARARRAPSKGIREPQRHRAPAWGWAALMLAIGGTLVVSQVFANSIGWFIFVAFVATPAWIALPWAPLHPRRRRIRDLLFTSGPILLWPHVLWLDHLTLRGYLEILGFFVPTLVGLVIVAAAPRCAPQAHPGSRGSPPRRRRPVSA